MNTKKSQLRQLPLGIADFRKIIEGNLVYVDKTQFIYQMATGGEYYFLSRPRRFGKSLLIATLAELFSGNKNLFKNLWIDSSDWNWPVHPVIRLDFSAIDNRTVDRLEAGISDYLANTAQTYGVDLSKRQTVGGKFEYLIQQLAQKNRVVILVDEYDKPILDHVENPEEAKEQRAMIKSLYTVIKSSDQYLRFVLLTGVSKFAQTSIFSGINNLKDISMDRRYATMLGYTQQEVHDYLQDYLQLLAQKQKISYEAALQSLTDYYDGYRFAEESERVFNPYSVLLCCDEGDYKNYWFASGTPTFLMKLIKSGNYSLNKLDQHVMTAEELGAFEPDDIKIAALLYQTGYLTIKQYDSKTKEYTLDFPNDEVARSFNLFLISSYTQLTYRQTKTYAASIAQAFAAQDLQELHHILQSLCNEIPYTMALKREFDLQLILFSVFKLIGLEVDPEVTTSVGRADLIISFPKLVYVIELKFNKTAQEALAQIQDRRYYEKYENTGKKIILLGINFDVHEKLITVAAQSM